MYIKKSPIWNNLPTGRVCVGVKVGVGVTVGVVVGVKVGVVVGVKVGVVVWLCVGVEVPIGVLVTDDVGVEVKYISGQVSETQGPLIEIISPDTGLTFVPQTKTVPDGGTEPKTSGVPSQFVYVKNLTTPVVLSILLHKHVLGVDVSVGVGVIVGVAEGQ